MLLGDILGFGAVPLGAVNIGQSDSGMAEYPALEVDVTSQALLAFGKAPLTPPTVNVSPQTLVGISKAALPAATVMATSGALGALALAGVSSIQVNVTPQTMLGLAMAPAPTATIWLIPYIGADSVAASATVLAINASTLAVTEYSLSALDVLEHEGEVYFVTATGLVKLAANAAGVAGSITTGDLELADGSLSLNLARFEIKSDGELHLTATAHQDGGQRSVRYLIPTRAGVNDRNRNVKLGNGVLGNAWSFTIAPPTGQACNWSLGGWKIEPGQFKLRRR